LCSQNKIINYIIYPQKYLTTIKQFCIINKKLGEILQKLKYMLDVGSSSLRLLAVTNFSGKARIIAEESILYDGYLDGEFLTESELSDTLTQLIDKMVAKMRQSITSIIVGVPSDFCICVCKRISRKFVAPHKITTAEIEELYRSNAKFGNSEEYFVLNYSPMQFVLDDGLATLQPVGVKTASLVLDASYILVKRSFVEIMQQKFAEVGIKNVEFISTPLGQALACETEVDNNKPIAIVDVGHISTSVSVFKGEGLALLSSFSMGGGHISSDIMQVLGLSFKDAELIKRKAILTIQPNRNEYYEICSKGNLIKAPISITNQVVTSRIEMISKVVAEILSLDDVYKDIDVYLTGDGIANFKGVKTIMKDIIGRNVIDYKIPFNNSSDKFQTSKTGLASLAEILV